LYINVKTFYRGWGIIKDVNHLHLRCVKIEQICFGNIRINTAGQVTKYLINKSTFNEEFGGIGKLLYWDVEIPSKFGVGIFTKKKTTTYYADTSQRSMKKEENPLD
jgi:hypothetical protein